MTHALGSLLLMMPLMLMAAASVTLYMQGERYTAKVGIVCLVSILFGVWLLTR